MSSVSVAGRTSRDVISRLAADVWTAGSLEATEKYVHPDFTMTDLRAEMRVNGPAGYADNVNALRQGVTDVQMIVDQMLVDGSDIAWKWHMTARISNIEAVSPALRALSTQFPDVMLIGINGISMGRFRDGLLVEESREIDGTSLLEQSGWWLT